MIPFTFITDEASEKYCLDIVQEIVKLYDIPAQEAFALVNQQWHGTTIIGEMDWIYHELPETWLYVFIEDLRKGADGRYSLYCGLQKYFLRWRIFGKLIVNDVTIFTICKECRWK